MQHPQAKLIPMWMFIELDKGLTGFQINSIFELMRISQDDLIPQLKALKNVSNENKFKIIVCCSYRQPFVNDEDLSRMALAIGLRLEEQLRIAAFTGRIIFLNGLLSLDTEEKRRLIAVNDFEVFKYAALHGHLDVLNKLLELTPDRVQEMIAADSFRAFRNAAMGGDLDVFNKLLELAPDRVQEMIAADFFDAFRVAAGRGHLKILNKLIELAPGSVQEMIAANDFDAFQKAALGGHLDVLNKLIELAPGRVQEMIAANSFAAFKNAALGGHLDVLNKLIELAPDRVQEMIAADSFRAFRCAALGGNLDVFNKLLELAPDRVEEMIAADYFGAFLCAAVGGHLDILNKLIERALDRVREMNAACSYRAFQNAAKYGRLNILNKLLELMPEDIIQEMLAANSFSVYYFAEEQAHMDIVNKLLTFPGVLNYVEDHCFVGNQTYPPLFIEKKLKTFLRRKAAGHASIVVTQQEAQSCIIILRFFMRTRPSTPELLGKIDFLMAIPAVRSILHRPIISAQGGAIYAIKYHPYFFQNELLRKAMKLGHRDMIARLLAIPEVLAQAERDNFYPEEARGQIDLRGMVQNHVSSSMTLSPQEQLGFTVPEAPVTDVTTHSQSSDEEQTPPQSAFPLITCDMLPNDPSGSILEQFERDEEAIEARRSIRRDGPTNFFGSGTSGDEVSKVDNAPAP